jgi:glycerophosphoryl diester phosphodiesterase
MTRLRTRRPVLLGHRGARVGESIRENTFASFDQALADGCDGFEFDVRLTADGQAVVCHDPEFEGVEIAQVTAAKLGRLPTLEAVLARYRESAFLDIELKVAGLEVITTGLLRKYPPRRGFVVSSFLAEVLKAVHELDAAIPLGLICESSAQLRGWSQLPLEYVFVHEKLATSAVIQQVKEAGKKIFVWTVNSAASMRRFRESAADGLISDDPGLLVRVLR